MGRFDTISFLSDYGRADEFVGIVHSVIRSIAPSVAVIDITHDVPPYDVRAGGLTLARSVQYLVPGVVLAVVDPGVGTGRRAIAVEVGDGESVLVGPDNGLLAPAVALVGGATRAVSLTATDYHLPAPGATFAGRDVFAPAAAHLCNGVDLTELGDLADPATLCPGLLPVSRAEGGGILGEVLWVDRYGNAQLNVDPEEVEPFGDRVQVRISASGAVRTATRAVAFDDLRAGQIGLVVDSYGLLCLAVTRGSAAAELGLAAGDEVALVPYENGGDAGDDERRSGGHAMPVTLRGRGDR
jgi:S-adenosylmethionine hydrolase